MFVNSEHTAIIVCFRNIDIKEKVLQPRFNYGEILSLSFGTTMKNFEMNFCVLWSVLLTSQIGEFCSYWVDINH